MKTVSQLMIENNYKATIFNIRILGIDGVVYPTEGLAMEAARDYYKIFPACYRVVICTEDFKILITHP